MRYIDGLLAWEYPDDLLLTLCDECHKKWHGLLEDKRPERLKPVFVYRDLQFESRPVRSIRDVIIEMIHNIRDGK